MSYSLLLSPEAEKDIISILEYTLSSWGAAQCDHYSDMLNNGLLMITDNPYIGRVRSDISRCHRSMVVHKHIIIYFVEGETIYVSRVVHHARDVGSMLL